MDNFGNVDTIFLWWHNKLMSFFSVFKYSFPHAPNFNCMPVCLKVQSMLDSQSSCQRACCQVKLICKECSQLRNHSFHCLLTNSYADSCIFWHVDNHCHRVGDISTWNILPITPLFQLFASGSSVTGNNGLWEHLPCNSKHIMGQQNCSI